MKKVRTYIFMSGKTTNNITIAIAPPDIILISRQIEYFLYLCGEL